ncbi:MAG: tyrosine recombinase XerC [Clostridia bacterium]|nr:tyrosine recombinase XerC [Clostridia bacterium]
MAQNIKEYPELIREYASYKQTIQGCSPKTVTEYLFDLRTFCRYMILTRAGETPDEESMRETPFDHLDLEFFKSVTTSEIYEFLLYVDKERANSKAALARKLCAVRMFYKYLTVKRGLMENSPAANIESPKQKRQLPKHLSVEESVDLLSAVQEDTSSNSRARDYAILTLFLNCGLRLSELAGIRFADLDPELRSMRVIGKGSKERIVYLNDACREAIKAYLPIRRAAVVKPKEADALFISRQGKRISVKTVQWMVKKYLGAAGLAYKNYSTHKLRHTAATLMYQTGKVDIRVLKDILGHEQLTTTQIYTHVSDKGMEQAMAENPLANVSIKPKKKRLSEVDGETDQSEGTDETDE